MTWLLVMISPPLVMITPEPVDGRARGGADLDDARADRRGDPGDVPFLLEGTTLVLVVLEVATVSLPVSSWKAYAVPPPTAAATIATAASSASGPFAASSAWAPRPVRG
jgi:hypothetical protein